MVKDNARLECMIDIETLGLKPGSVVASIGAIIFDADGFHVDRFFARLNLQDQLSNGATVDGSTIAFWMAQSDAARLDAFLGETESTRVALVRLRAFLDLYLPEKIWAKSPQFDVVHIDGLTASFGHPNLWSYRAPRDVRTVLDLVPEYVTKLDLDGSEHKALDDCAYQIAQLTAARNWLNAPHQSGVEAI